MLRYKANLPTGEGAPCDSEATAASSSEGHLQKAWKKQNTQQEEEIKEKGKDYKASVGIEEKHAGPQQSQSQTVLMLCFSEDQSFSKTPFGDNQNVSGDKHSLLDSAHPEQSDTKEMNEVSKVTEQSGSDVLSFEDDERFDDSSSMEEEIEPSTDEELRLWRYPQHKELNIADRQEDVNAKDEKEALVSPRDEKKSGRRVVADSDHSNTQGDDFGLSTVSAEISGSSELQKDEKDGQEAGDVELDVSECFNESVRYKSPLNRDQENVESNNGCDEEAAIEDTAKHTEERTHLDDVWQQSKQIQTVNIKEEDMDLDSGRTGPNTNVKEIEASPFSDVALVVEETQSEHTDVESEAQDVAQLETKTYAGPLDGDTHGAAQSVTEAQASAHLLETEEMEEEAEHGGKRVRDGITEEETCKAEGRDISKKVTFVLEPELINDETNCSVESRTETSTSGEKMSNWAA